MMVLPGVSTKPEAKGPCLPALPDGLTQFVHCVHVTHCCPRSDSGGLEAPSRRGGGDTQLPTVTSHRHSGNRLWPPRPGRTPGG